MGVIGGGPSGCATALTLRHWGHSVTVIEQTGYEKPRIGEILPPSVRDPLVQLGAWEPFVAGKPLPSPGFQSVWGGDDCQEKDFIFHPHGSGWHLDRASFDAMLAQTAQEAGANVLRGTRVISARAHGADGWMLALESRGGRLRCRARFIVDATGRASSFACQQGAVRKSWDHLVAATALFTGGGDGGTVGHRALVEAVEGGWWYSALLPDRRMVVALMTDADSYAAGCHASEDHWHRELAATRRTRSRVNGWSLLGVPRVVSANTSRLDRFAGDHWLAVGDAAMAFDPLSAQGVHKALDSGIQAGQCIHRQLGNEKTALKDYALRLENHFSRYLKARTYYYARERRWPQSPFWARRIGPILASWEAGPLKRRGG